MNILAVVASLIGVNVAGAISPIPGDNRGYVEGESKYIWMSDGEEPPQIVDLKEPIDESVFKAANGTNNQYWLYTRQNPDNYQVLMNGNIQSVLNSNYDANRSTTVIVHGWHNNGKSPVNVMCKNAFLQVQDCNVIVVDWRKLASYNYVSAANGVKSVGEYLGDFLQWLFSNAGGNWNDLHLVGHSLGAHVVGNAGRQTGGRPRRITGLDPAGPLWKRNSHALNIHDGNYVEAIHTDGGALGLFDPLGHVDFYPNGGKNPQPGCLFSPCSHSRSYQFFAASVRYNHFSGHKCTDLSEVKANRCYGLPFNMGNGELSKLGYGIFRVDTDKTFPFLKVTDK